MTTTRGLLAGDRGRLLGGLLAAEFGTAVQLTAAATVLPLASRDLHGAALFGAASAGPSFASIALVVLTPTIGARLGPRATYAVATAVYVVGIAVAALAPDMAFVLAGRLLQGAAAGLFAAFGLSAIGGLYEDAVRPRVLGLFAVMWLLPSLLGPVVNAAVATAVGWRWALAWPALLVVAAQLTVGTRVGLLPRGEQGARLPLLPSLAALAGLAVAAAVPSALPLPWSVAVFTAAVLVAVGGSVRVVRAFASGRRGTVVLLFGALAASFFAGESVLPLGLVAVAGGGVAGAAIAFAAGGITWSLFGLRTPSGVLRDKAGAIGSVGIALGCISGTAITLAGVQGWPALVGTTLAWALAGAAMGIGYPVLSAASFDAADRADVPRLAAAVAFAESGATALAALLGGGVYSLTAGVLPPAAAVGSGWAVAAVFSVGTAMAGVALARVRS